MSQFLHLAFIILAVIAVAVADVFLKQAAVMGNWALTLKSPWLLGALILYLYQILFFTYIFVTGGRLSFVGSLQTALYALIVIGTGIVFFQERLTVLQSVGVCLAVIGAILITLE